MVTHPCGSSVPAVRSGLAPSSLDAGETGSQAIFSCVGIQIINGIHVMMCEMCEMYDMILCMRCVRCMIYDDMYDMYDIRV